MKRGIISIGIALSLGLSTFTPAAFAAEKQEEVVKVETGLADKAKELASPYIKIGLISASASYAFVMISVNTLTPIGAIGTGYQSADTVISQLANMATDNVSGIFYGTNVDAVIFAPISWLETMQSMNSYTNYVVNVNETLAKEGYVVAIDTSSGAAFALSSAGNGFGRVAYLQNQVAELNAQARAELEKVRAEIAAKNTPSAGTTSMQVLKNANDGLNDLQKTLDRMFAELEVEKAAQREKSAKAEAERKALYDSLKKTNYDSALEKIGYLRNSHVSSTVKSAIAAINQIEDSTLRQEAQVQFDTILKTADGENSVIYQNAKKQLEFAARFKNNDLYVKEAYELIQLVQDEQLRSQLQNQWNALYVKEDPNVKQANRYIDLAKKTKYSDYEAKALEYILLIESDIDRANYLATWNETFIVNGVDPIISKAEKNIGNAKKYKTTAAYREKAQYFISLIQNEEKRTELQKELNSI
ncbi:hypothetical protein [Neobacillus sp. YIM B06451]|uniref:hypothetical protein n=1 Tax=Neobacillus sp. YIM B06451 TaxID=3070994 RepID=UPI0029306F93|nr:hypothetical protein [Neobacillus sp. YIM B06451]